MNELAMVRRHRAAWSWCAWVIAAWLGVVVTAFADDQVVATAKPTTKHSQASADPQITALRPGFDGHFKAGYWAPFLVELQGGAKPFTGRLEFTVPDSDGVPSRVHAPATRTCELAAGETKSVLLYAKLGLISGDVTARFVGETGPSVVRRFQAGGPALAGVMPSSSRLILSVGEVRNQSSGNNSTRGPDMIHLENIASLPPDWWGLEGVDTVIVHSGDSALSDELANSAAQLEALDLWVRMGGQLVLSVGSGGETLLREGAPLARFAPGPFESVVPLRQATMIETYTETTEPLAPGSSLLLPVSKLRNVRGRVEAFAGSGTRDLPLVVRTPHGFGQIVFVAFDLDRQPIANWSARPQLLQKILGTAAVRSTEESTGMLGAVTTLGFVDLAGQLRGALDQFPGVSLVPFWLVALLVTAYLLCIGPLDYYFVKYVLKRPDATWLTFSLTVVLFSAGAVATAYAFKGRELRINQLDIVDFDAESGFVRGTSWSNLFSPRIDTYDLSLEPQVGNSHDTNHRDVLFSWFGLTGSGFGGIDAGGGPTGGMGTAANSLPLFTVAYDYSARLDRIKHVPIAEWSSKAFIGRWWRNETPGDIAADLADDGRLVGTISNNLAVPLKQAVLIYDRWAYVIRDFEPGRQIDLAFDIDPQTVDTYLRKVTAVGDRKVVSPYDQESFDVPRLVEIMTAQKLSGGKTYTGLNHQYQGYIELSNLVRAGRAVLIGRVEKPAATLVRDGQPLGGDDAETQNWSFYRYVFPVAEREAP